MLYQSKDNMLKTQKPGRGSRPADYIINRKRQYLEPQIATLNNGTMTGRSSEIVEMLSRHNVDTCCMQETRWKDELARKIMGQNCHYKFFWKGGDSRHDDVGLLIKKMV